MLYGRGWSIAQLRFAGRWTAEKSLEHYIQQAMATPILNRLEPHTVHRLRRLGPLCLNLLLHPADRTLPSFMPKVVSSSGPSLIRWCACYADLSG